MTIGSRISQIRKQKGFTQEYIAQQLNVSRQAVSKWEKDLTAPDTKNLIALAEVLDMSVSYLANGNAPDLPRDKKFTPLPFHRVSYLFFWPGIILYLYGVVGGTFNRMVMIPFTERGDAFGIPFLYYGTSPFAHGLLTASVLCLLMAFLFRVIGHCLSK